MLKSVELNEFQAHKKLIVNFTNGVNVLVGASFSGKSCIRRAIEWVLFNKKIDGIRREGSKKTSVKITLDNDIVIERIRTATINRYVLNCNGEEKVFDSIGKTMPQEIKDAIGINPIEVDGEELWLNSAPQIALPFLFDKSPTWRMKLFNKLTGNDLLDKLFVQFNKYILKIGRDHKSNTERLEDLTKQSEEKEIEKEQLEAIHKNVQKIILNLQATQYNYDKYMCLLDLQQNNQRDLKTLISKKTDVKFPKDTEIKQLTTKIGILNELKILLSGVLSNVTEISRVGVELLENATPDIDIVELNGKIDRIDTLKTVIKGQNHTKTRIDDLLVKIGNIDSELKEYNEQLNELIENTEDCPLCGQGLSSTCKNMLKNN